MNELIPVIAASPLRQRLIDDMNMRHFGRETQRNYIRDVGRFATWLGRSPHTATAEDVRRFQIEQHEAGVPVPTMNNLGEGPKKESEEEIPEPPSDPVTVMGDLWLLDDHRLLCGDSTKLGSFVSVLGGKLADCIFTDIPWNIPIAGFVSGLGKTKHQDFKMAAGEMSEAEFGGFIEVSHQLCAKSLKPGSAFFSCIDWRSVDQVMAAGKRAGLRHINIAVWNKGSGGMGAPYRSAHELVVVFCKGEKLSVNNVELGKRGRDRTNVWSYPGANRPGSSAGKALKHHPTPKPVEMVEDALLDVTKRGALILDPFLGSGTTLLAAERSGRRACGIDLDPAFVEVAIRRWEELTGKAAIHAESGMTFEERVHAKDSGQLKDAA